MKKIQFLIAVNEFAIKRNRGSKERFNLLLKFIYMNQNGIDHDMYVYVHYRTSNVNDVPLLALDTTDLCLERLDDALKSLCGILFLSTSHLAFCCLD